MAIDETYHEGELHVQELAGERDEALLNARAVADHIVAPAFRFLAQQRYFVLGHASSEHECEGTVLFGPPGFLSAEHDGKLLSVALDPGRNRGSDPVLAAIDRNDRVGGLAIDLSTRRRMRINGLVRALEPDRLVVEVHESYANCPKYVHKRVLEATADPGAPAPEDFASGTVLGDAQRATIRRSDTLFVVTVHPHGHADASHRGGEPGFVKLGDDDTLRIPDYPGNSMFNTLGNVFTNPAAALIFWDFERDRLLHLSGTATLELGAPDPNDETGGTGRFWAFRARRFCEQPVVAPFRLRWLEASRFNPRPTR